MLTPRRIEGDNVATALSLEVWSGSRGMIEKLEFRAVSVRDASIASAHQYHDGDWCDSSTVSSSSVCHAPQTPLQPPFINMATVIRKRICLRGAKFTSSAGFSDRSRFLRTITVSFSKMVDSINHKSFYDVGVQLFDGFAAEVSPNTDPYVVIRDGELCTEELSCVGIFTMVTSTCTFHHLKRPHDVYEGTNRRRAAHKPIAYLQNAEMLRRPQRDRLWPLCRPISRYVHYYMQFCESGHR